MKQHTADTHKRNTNRRKITSFLKASKSTREVLAGCTLAVLPVGARRTRATGCVALVISRSRKILKTQPRTRPYVHVCLCTRFHFIPALYRLDQWDGG